METMKRLLRAELTMLVGEIKQYYLNYIFYNISIFFLIIGLVKNFYGESSNTLVFVLVTNAVTWQIVSSAINYLCYLIQDEAMLGTLEQITVTRTSITLILISKILINLAFSVMKGILLLFACVFILGKWQVFHVVPPYQLMAVLLIVTLNGFEAYCTGAIFGGLTLYHKRIGSIVNVFQYFLLLFTGAFQTLSLFPRWYQICIRILPIANANILVRQLIMNTASYEDILMFVGSCLLWIGAGYFIFKYLLSTAKRDGKLGQY